MTKQDLYNLFIVFAKRGFGNGIIHFVPAKSGSLSELYGNILIVDFFTKFWWKFFYSLRKLTLFFLMLNSYCSHYPAKDYSLILVDSFFSFLQEVFLIQVLAILYFLLFFVAEKMANRPFLWFFSALINRTIVSSSTHRCI